MLPRELTTGREGRHQLGSSCVNQVRGHSAQTGEVVGRAGESGMIAKESTGFADRLYVWCERDESGWCLL